MKIYECDCAVVGSGAAGYAAAVRIKQSERRRVVLISEDIMCGTSRNAGSDKQTYYKLSLSGDAPDSVRKMAEDLYSCGAVDGDNALCEAALSARCFLSLCDAGVEFPTNAYGEYIGYKTDHDPCARASSAGPLTSKLMTEALERKAQKLGLDILDRSLVIEILKDSTGVCGLLCISTESGELFAVRTPYVIVATGGPGGIYADSVYPLGHTGSTSLALRAGAALQNLTEWQYGLASKSPRWNVSGTYMQALPRFVSIDKNGVEREFLSELFADEYEALSAVFLKGYQWPFDSRKVLDGSSVIDLLVYRETVMRGRRVYLDYTKNPFSLRDIDYSKLSGECFEYLSRAGATFGTPIDRLKKMNTPAVEFYKSKSLDLTREYLQIALCAQHNNGGISVDAWWQTDVRGLFAIGECAGTHGITRPGGSALNAGQVGALRAATYINEIQRCVDFTAFEAALSKAEAKNALLCQTMLGNTDNIDSVISEVTCTMSEYGAAIRTNEGLDRAIEKIFEIKNTLAEKARVEWESKLYKIYKLTDIVDVSLAVLSAMKDYGENAKLTRGSSLIYAQNGELRRGLDECFRFAPADKPCADMIQELCQSEDGYSIQWRKTRPIPTCDNFFENVWQGYLKNKNIF